MTIDDLAAAAQEEFQAIRSEMATKEQLKEMRTEILGAIEALDVHLSAYASRTNDDISNLQASMEEFDSRLRLVEKQK